MKPRCKFDENWIDVQVIPTCKRILPHPIEQEHKIAQQADEDGQPKKIGVLVTRFVCNFKP